MPSRMRFAGLAVAAVTLSLTVAGAPAAAWADEAAPTTAADAMKIVDKLKAEQAELDRQYNDIEKKVTELGGRADAQRAQIDATDKRIAAIKSQLGAVALASYQGRGSDSPLGLLTSADANSFLSRIGTVDQVASNQTATLQSFQTEQANLTDLQRALAANEASAKEELKRLEEVDKAARAKVEEAQKVADKLSADEKARFEAERSARSQAEAARIAAAEANGAHVDSTAEQRIAAASSRPAGIAEAADGSSVVPRLALGPNRYTPGQCTWWGFERRAQLGAPIGGMWGNANQWPGSARAAGFPVDGTPSVGAILVQFNAPVGHIAVVESVNGGMITVSEMNYRGVGIVSYRTLPWAGAGLFIH